jgi:hypothetical protein
MLETNSNPAGDDFGTALTRLRDGYRVQRSGWNGKGMWLMLIEGHAWQLHGLMGTYERSPFIAMKTADDKIVPWLASQTDILAHDWKTLTG